MSAFILRSYTELPDFQTTFRLSCVAGEITKHYVKLTKQMTLNTSNHNFHTTLGKIFLFLKDKKSHLIYTAKNHLVRPSFVWICIQKNFL